MSSRAAEAGRSRAVPFLVLALLALAALTGPVRAAESEPGFPGSELDLELTEFEAIDAMIEIFDTGEFWLLDEELRLAVLDDLLLEVALLHHLGGFRQPAPVFVVDIHDAYGPWPDASRAATVDFLFEVDDALAALKNDVNAQLGPAPILAVALDELPTGQRNALSGGAGGPVDVVPYAQALNELLSFGNSQALMAMGARNAPLIADLPIELSNPELPSELDTLRTENAALRAEVDELQAAIPGPETANPGSSDTAASTVPPTDPGQRTPWLLIAASIGALLLIAALGVWLTRRRSQPDVVDVADDGPTTREILEAHRRLTAALDEAEIGRIGCATAISITSASDAFIFRDDPGGLRRIGDPSPVAGSALDRVVETAQPLVAVLDADAAVGAAAVCAVPLVSDGTVGAVLVARRPSDRPFDNEDRRRLEMLAPALGGALASADTLGSYEHMALVDGLTSLGNRRRLDGDLETTLSEAIAHDLPVAFAMIDVDHFKHFNDTHGHEAGDRALQTVARVITETVRATDIVYRYGGEEFSVLLPGATLVEASVAAERMRAAVEAARIDGEESQPGGCLTVSVGISTLESGDAAALKSRADEALYTAKDQGRNRAVIA